MSSTSAFHNTKLVFMFKIEYKQTVIHIKTIATAVLLRGSALPTHSTLKPTKQAIKFSNVKGVG